MEEQEKKEEFIRAAHQMKKVNVQRVFSEISQGEFFVLEILNKEYKKEKSTKGTSVSTLAKKLQIAPPAASRFLHNLEEKQLIQRKIDMQDRRNTEVYLTEIGKEVHDRAAKEMGDFFGRVIHKMGEEKTDQFIMLMNEIANIMKEEIEHTIERKSNAERKTK